MGKRSQEVQTARRLAAMDPQELLERRTSMEFGPGAPVRTIEIRDLFTGIIRRWTVLQGPRLNNFILRSPSGKTSKPHGTAWIMNKLRRVLLTGTTN